jgi:hypothetical protein
MPSSPIRASSLIPRRSEVGTCHWPFSGNTLRHCRGKARNADGPNDEDVRPFEPSASKEVCLPARLHEAVIVAAARCPSGGLC